MLAIMKNRKNILLVPILLAIVGSTYYLSITNFLILHTFIELGVAVVAITIFLIGLNTSEYSQNNFITILSSGYLIVGVLTVFHAITYEGMGVIQVPVRMSSQFWVAARYTESITLLLSTFYITNNKYMNIKKLSLISVLITIIITSSIFLRIFPVTYVDGKGLTLFKIISEYIICLIFFISAIRIWNNRDYFDNDNLISIILSLLIKIVSEYFFTLYVNLFGLVQYLGHMTLIFSIMLTYYSLIRGTLTKPYKQLFINLDEINNELSIKDFAIESSVSAVILFNLNGIITYTNKSFLKLTGYSHKEEVIGQPMINFIHSKTFHIFKDIFEINKSWSGEVITKRKDHSMVDCHMTLNYVLSKENIPVSIMASFTDITESKKHMSDLIKAKKDAEEASIAKSHFLANMSHEIRTPMNGILGFINLLEKTRINSKQASYINYIKISTETLLNVINDILDVSKIEAGKLELEKIPFELRTTVENAMIPFLAKAEEKGIDLNLTFNRKIPKYFLGDPTRLRQIITNLVNNAIKFTDSGSVTVEVSLIDSNDYKYHLRFSVKDTGIGMSQDTIKRIFDPFAQADNSSTRKYGGTGLGLSICKSFVELMGGTIFAESTEGLGSTFIFNITLAETTMLIQETDDSSDDELEITVCEDSDLSILLVDDNEVNRALIIMLLNIININCDVAVNGEEAVLACQKKKYDIILMDCQMPVMDGFEATKQIRKNASINQFTTIIALTASAMKGDIERCLDAGMDDYLSKPVNISQLTATIKKYTTELVDLSKNEYEYVC